METIQKTSEKSNIINMEKYNPEKNGNEKNQKHLKRCRYIIIWRRFRRHQKNLT